MKTLLIGALSLLSFATAVAAPVTRFETQFKVTKDVKTVYHYLIFDIYNLEQDPVLINFYASQKTAEGTASQSPWIFLDELKGFYTFTNSAAPSSSKYKNKSLRIDVDIARLGFYSSAIFEWLEITPAEGEPTQLKFKLTKDTSTYTVKNVEVRNFDPSNYSFKSRSSFGITSQISSKYAFEPGNTKILKEQAIPAFDKIFAYKSVESNSASQHEGDLAANDKKERKRRKKIKDLITFSVFNSVNSSQDLKLAAGYENLKPAVWDLLQAKDKPSVAQMIALFGGSVPSVNPFKAYSKSSREQTFRERLPRVIAAFEKAFPGATWYALGRDIYDLGDALDSYYTFIGEGDRVKKLPASQPSFYEKFDAPYLEMDPLVVGFLKTHGISLDTAFEGPPKVIFDFTSYSYSSYRGRPSQSRQLMGAIYEEFKRRGGNPRDLLSRINFISVSSGEPITPSLDIESFFATMKFEYGPNKILNVNEPSFGYGPAWHGVYETFRRNVDGTVVSPAGPQASISEKLGMLSQLYETMSALMNDDFHQRVNQQMKEFGIEAFKKKTCPDNFK